MILSRAQPRHGEMNPTVGQGIFGVVFNDIYSRIKPYDPEVYTSHRLTARH